jgi:hypothetical protein
MPQYVMGIPPSACTPAFYGGFMVAKYTPLADAFTWQLSITAGRPFLTE